MIDSLDNFNLIDFFLNALEILKTGALTIYNILSTRIPVRGLMQFIKNLIEIFGGTPPEFFTQIQESGISVISIIGASAGVVIIIILIKKIVPFF